MSSRPPVFFPSFDDRHGSLGTRTALELLDSCAEMVACPPGRPAICRNEPADHWYRVARGVARKCVMLPNGRRQIVDLLLPGDFFGLVAREDRCLSLEAAVEGTVVADYPCRRLEALAATDPKVARELRDVPLRVIARLQTQLTILGRTTAMAKVGAFLLSMERRLADGSDGAIELPISRYDIADYLAISVETVSRSLTALRTRGAINFSGSRRLKIIDHPVLDEDERRDPQYALERFESNRTLPGLQRRH